ncbi:helix-turn-helix domain-containing protein [Schinkia azotoformans]|uniref:helix-turn-helix domain-containing protein n=1 Tax=Schinkia azotoformans TaxID=1454 RepID=UPI002DB6BF92|nr:helix-turn-helix transcriptional regulator [Schinkia azotoformans]MEC1744161.1 helix-turn-helix transcriptional regulator [Schinkia azotoformans]
MDTLGERLRYLRKEKAKLSQEKLGKLFGLSESAIGMYERNERKPDYETLNKFADFFGVTTDYLQGRTDTPAQTTKNELPELTTKDEKDIAKKLEAIINDLESDTGLAFDGEPMDDTTRELVLAQIESNLRLAKQLAKKKFTPKKYRDD